MERLLLAAEKIHPEALKFMAKNHEETIKEIIEAIEKNKIVVVGMDQNPFVKKARNILRENQMEYTYLSYGSYLSKWRQRLAIKLWSGWPTFPQVFIEGKLIGGASDLANFLKK